MKKILVPIGCRSDEGLSAPIIKRLKEHFVVECPKLFPQDFGKSYDLMDAWLHARGSDSSLVFITGDRVEMCAAAAAAFHNKVKIAHYYSGVINDPVTTYDDIDRHCITLWSDIQFCENIQAQWVVWDLKKAARLPVNCHDVGISHLDDLEIDESKVPGEPFDLVLVNNPTLLEENHFGIKGSSRYIIHIGGNPDGIAKCAPNWASAHYYPNLPRPQFIGLLKNCQRFITNSSSAIYEAPHFLKPEQIVMVGDRNRNRPRGPFKTGASDKIVAILREYLK